MSFAIILSNNFGVRESCAPVLSGCDTLAGLLGPLWSGESAKRAPCNTGRLRSPRSHEGEAPPVRQNEGEGNPVNRGDERTLWFSTLISIQKKGAAHSALTAGREGC